MRLAGLSERIRADQGSVAMGSAIAVAFNALSLVAYGIGSVLVNRQIGPERAGQLTWFVTTTQITSIFADLIGVHYSNLQMTASGSHFPEAEVRTTVLVYAASWMGVAVATAYLAGSGFGRFRLSYPAACWRTGLRGYTQNLLSLVHQPSDQFVIGRYLGWTDLGLTVVANLAEVLAQIPGSIGKVIFTDSARQQDCGVGARALVMRAAYFMGGIAILGLLLYISGPFVVGLLYGPAFVAAAPILGAYVAALIVQSGVLMANSHVSAGGFPAHELVAIGCAAVNVAVGIALAPSHGTVGVATALGVSYSVWLALIARRTIREADYSSGGHHRLGASHA